MCGIAGMIRKDSQYVSYASDVLRDLIYFNRPRGVDALGVFRVNASSRDHDSIKEVGEPLKVLSESKFSSFISSAGNNRFIVAHNRHATRGEKKDQGCAQPFLVKKASGNGVIILVHNGTLTNIRNEKEFPGKTDSHSLAKMIAAGLPLTEIERNVWGSLALCWYDSDEYALHFVRNKDRPFGFVESTDNSIWFGSELYLAGAAMERRGIGVKSFEKLPVWEEWIWHADDKKWEKKKVPLKPYVHSGSGAMQVWHPNAYTEGEDSYELEEEYRRLQQREAEGRTLLGEVLGASGTSSSTGSGRTAVEVPFSMAGSGISSDSAVPLAFLPPPSGNSVGSARKYNAPLNRDKKPRYGQVEEGMGYKRGDIVTFSLSNYTKTSRDNQIKLEGKLVVFVGGKDPKFSLVTAVDVHGMVGMVMDVMDKTTGLWQGKITNLALATLHSGSKVYKFSVKEVKVIKDADPFRASNLYRYNPKSVEEVKALFEAAANPLKPAQNHLSPADKAALPGSRKAEEREFSDSKGTFICDDCHKGFSVKTKHRVQWGASNPVEFELCRECFKLTIQDSTHLDTLTNIVAMHKQAAELSSVVQKGMLH